MTSKNRQRLAAAVVLPACLLSMSYAASASVITLTNGDSVANGGQVTLNPSLGAGYAIALGDTTTTGYTVQGVTFSAANPSNAAINPYGSSEIAIIEDGYTFHDSVNLLTGWPASPDTDSANLQTMAQHLVYTSAPVNGKNQVATISGLQYGQSYQVDLFIDPGGAAAETNTYVIYENGNTTTPVDTVSAVISGSNPYTDGLYDVEETISAMPDGTISIEEAGSPSNSSPAWSAIEVSSPVPEPASLALVGMGAAMLLVRRLRKERPVS